MRVWIVAVLLAGCATAPSEPLDEGAISDASSGMALTPPSTASQRFFLHSDGQQTFMDLVPAPGVEGGDGQREVEGRASSYSEDFPAEGVASMAYPAGSNVTLVMRAYSFTSGALGIPMEVTLGADGVRVASASGPSLTGIVPAALSPVDGCPSIELRFTTSQAIPARAALALHMSVDDTTFTPCYPGGEAGPHMVIGD